MEKRKAIETETERLWKSVDNQTGEKGAKVGLTIDWQYLYIAVIYLLLGISQVCIQRWLLLSAWPRRIELTLSQGWDSSRRERAKHAWDLMACRTDPYQTDFISLREHQYWGLPREHKVTTRESTSRSDGQTAKLGFRCWGKCFHCWSRQTCFMGKHCQYNWWVRHPSTGACCWRCSSSTTMVKSIKTPQP